MDNHNSTIRLIYPQWQGGIISHWIPDIPAEDSARGYYLGAQLLNVLAPKNENQKVFEVPVSLDIKRKEQDGVMDKDAILEQTKAAMDILNKNNPDRIVILGGECSVSVVPFTYLAKKYNNDVAMIWIDAHPDITLPEDRTYAGYHAMAAAAIMGDCDRDIISQLPASIPSDKILFVGLRDWERQQIKNRHVELGIRHLTPEQVAENSSEILEWIKSTGAKHVVIHFDMDVLDPNEVIAAVGVVPNGMKIGEVVRVINDIADNYDVVGLTIAEPMPRVAIKLRNMLNQMPLLN